MKPMLHGVDGHDALFNVAGKGVVVNTRSLSASVSDLEELALSRFWVSPSTDAPVGTWKEIARCAVETPNEPDVVVLAAGTESRAYTIPKAVVREAQTGLEQSRTDRTGVSPAARHVGALLAAGGQVQLRDVLHIARYFERNTPEAPGWRLWGGNFGRSWSQSIAAKNPAALTAAADPEVNLLDFYNGDETERAFWVKKDSTESPLATALYKPTDSGDWVTWVNGDWVVATTPDPSSLYEVDDDTAVFVASSLFDAPDVPVNLDAFDPEEWEISREALPGLDWDLIERVMAKPASTPRPQAPATTGDPGNGGSGSDPVNIDVPANVPPLPDPENPPVVVPPVLSAAAGDGDYTPEERSENVKSQPRDAAGRFASVGDTGTLRGGVRGTIRTVNPTDGSLIIDGEDGEVYQVSSADFTIDSGEEPEKYLKDRPAGKSGLPPLNLDKILGQPRVSKTTPKAWMKTLLQPMGAGQIKQVVKDYEEFIRQERKKRAADFPGDHPKFSAEELSIDEKPNPDNSDVPPIYLAIVDRDDPRAVTDLVAMIPASTVSTEVTTYRRVGGEWVEDVKMLQDLRSSVPPPVVKLDEETYQDVLSQVDSSMPDEEPADSTVAAGVNFEPVAILAWDEDGNLCGLAAAGGADRNRGGAETLRRYWLYGKGAAKIRWGTPGDWRRCVRQLSKHMGERAKGYCALRHKEATGMWTGDRRHRGNHSLIAGGEVIKSTDEIKRLPEVLRASANDARALAAKHRVYGMADGISPVPQDAGEISEGRAGRAFRIPLVIPEGLESGDGRKFRKGSLSMRSFPLPLMWQIKTGDGHDGSFLVGRIDRVERTEDGLGNAYGVFDTGPYGAEAQRLVENKMLRFVSADLDRFEAEEVELADDEDGGVKQQKLDITAGRLMGVTIVQKPAFQECTIELIPLEEETVINDGTYEGEPTGDGQVAIVASSGIASRIPVEPPKTWFQRPVLNGPTPITVTDEGQVFGHIATWDVSHIGLPGATRAPRSASNYAYFHTGVVRTSEGEDVTVGQLTLAGGHADLTADAVAAVKHYDDTGSAICDVHAGEDSYGIWVAGALRPGTTPEQVRTLRASAPSGDWRNINGRLELVAVCQVNVPGFPVARAQVASGALRSLVAAGASVLAKMQHEDTLQARIARLEASDNERDQRRREAAIERMRPVFEEREAARAQMESLAASARERVFKALDVDGYLAEFKDFSPEKREKLAKEKKALKDGSFPIENAADLRRAVHAYGRASDDRKAAVRRHIVRRARALGKTDLVPQDWAEASLNDLALNARDARDVITAAALANRAEELRNRVRKDG